MINSVSNNIFSISIMNTVLRGSLIQRPKSIPHPTLMPRKERMWHAEHFGNVSETKGKIAAAKGQGKLLVKQLIVKKQK